MNFERQDAEYLREHGISPEQASVQLEAISIGFPFLELIAPATPGNGIIVPAEKTCDDAAEIWRRFIAQGGNVMKFTPASGAASRMFKNIHAFNDSPESVPKDDFMRKFFGEIESFPFFRHLNLLTVRYYQKSIPTLIAEKDYKAITTTMLDKEGMSYSSLPKALITFHIIPGSTRTAIEEHLAEGAQYARMSDGKVRLHFTISPEHLAIAQLKIEEIMEIMAKKYGVRYEIDFSVQKPSTDTIAADADGNPFRDAEGNLVLRPGGHGALIENLNDLDADVIFIKNIDNVVPDTKRAVSNRYKEIIGGILVGAKHKIDSYMRILDKKIPTDSELDEMSAFMRTPLSISCPGIESMTAKQKAALLKEKFNRPLRVCAMVRNDGEPGGGPWIVRSADGTSQPQILETSQIDHSSRHDMEMLAKSTHFNPVDLAVSIKDWKGDKFNLPDFVDRQTGFISTKSKDGKELKALELPGLWNGAMSDWNTIFVEVPSETFNPVKTVNDLLRPAHQPD